MWTSGLGLIGGLLLLGCGGDGSDGGSGDGGGGGDMSVRGSDDGGALPDDLALPPSSDFTMPPLAYVDHTAHAIDIANPSGTLVRLRGMVVTTPLLATPVKRTGGPAPEYFCRYSVWVQDPACTEPPCGLLLRTDAAAQATPPACPSTPADTLLGSLVRGDNIDVEGETRYQENLGPGNMGLAREHFILAHHVTPTAGTPATIDAVEITDDATLAAFASYSLDGDKSWRRYEGMYVRLVPSGGFVTSDNGLGWKTSPYDTPWAPSFVPRPAAGTNLLSAAGVVAPGHGGAIFPVLAGDLITAP